MAMHHRPAQESAPNSKPAGDNGVISLKPAGNDGASSHVRYGRTVPTCEELPLRPPSAGATEAGAAVPVMARLARTVADVATTTAAARARHPPPSPRAAGSPLLSVNSAPFFLLGKSGASLSAPPAQGPTSWRAQKNFAMANFANAATFESDRDAAIFGSSAISPTPAPASFSPLMAMISSLEML